MNAGHPGPRRRHLQGRAGARSTTALEDASARAAGSSSRCTTRCSSRCARRRVAELVAGHGGASTPSASGGAPRVGRVGRAKGVPDGVEVNSGFGQGAAALVPTSPIVVYAVSITVAVDRDMRQPRQDWSSCRRMGVRQAADESGRELTARPLVRADRRPPRRRVPPLLVHEGHRAGGRLPRRRARPASPGSGCSTSAAGPGRHAHELARGGSSVHRHRHQPALRRPRRGGRTRGRTFERPTPGRCRSTPSSTPPSACARAPSG